MQRIHVINTEDEASIHIAGADLGVTEHNNQSRTSLSLFINGQMHPTPVSSQTVCSKLH